MGAVHADVLSHADDVQAHLEFAAATVDGVVLTVGEREILGRLTFPDPYTGEIDFIPHPSLDGLAPAPDSGHAVRVDYEGPDDRYHFLTEVIRTPTSTWRLAPPCAVERRDKRVNARVIVLGLPDFTLHLSLDGVFTSVRLVDLSSGGVAFRYHPAHLTVEPGDVLEAALSVPGMVPMKVRMEIRHTRKAARERTAGAQFTEISLEHRLHLQHVVNSRL